MICIRTKRYAKLYSQECVETVWWKLWFHFFFLFLFLSVCLVFCVLFCFFTITFCCDSWTLSVLFIKVLGSKRNSFIDFLFYMTVTFIVSGVLYSFLWEDHIIANGRECWQAPVFFILNTLKIKKNTDGEKPHLLFKKVKFVDFLLRDD